MKRSPWEVYLFLVFLVLVQSQLTELLWNRSAASELQKYKIQEPAFRKMNLSEMNLNWMDEVSRCMNLTKGEALTIFHAVSEGKLNGRDRILQRDEILNWKRILMQYNETGYRSFVNAYGAIWNDIQCFPVDESGMTYENSWMFERTYGGKRGHEGTDLMPPVNVRGFYRIRSMTDGMVERIGWLPKGGYRIGIRSPSGGYFYYAHLEEYSREYQIGDTVTAGEVLGTMGDSGYGPEGTRGQFPVHLHLGIYIRNSEQAEMSVNPYWILRYLDK